jgi:O-acetyl-ADP-ribose deacetylase (regulator of RNase III)
MISKKLRNIVIEIIQADITTVPADVIVNAANNELWMGSGVAGVIKMRGGVAIEQEAMARGPIEPGEAVETKAGNLSHRFVIHAAVMGQDLRTGRELIKTSMRSALELADKLAMGSIVFPALGTGVGEFPIEECAEIMLNEAVGFDGRGPTHVKRVIFALFTPRAFHEFVKVYRDIK